jgi:hypothetical protein
VLRALLLLLLLLPLLPVLQHAAPAAAAATAAWGAAAPASTPGRKRSMTCWPRCGVCGGVGLCVLAASEGHTSRE